MEGFAITLFIDLFKNIIESKIPQWKEQREFKTFLKNIESWCNDFITANEVSAVSTSHFYDYINDYNLIGRIIDFIRQQNNIAEEKFLADCYNNALAYLKEKKAITNNDERVVKEFINKLFANVLDFYKGKVPTEDVATAYFASQANTKLDTVKDSIDRLQDTLTASSNAPENSTPSINKKQYFMPENTILRKIDTYKSITEGYSIFANPEDMLEACEINKKIVLLGEAGCGKSIALKQLAALACKTDYYPLLVDLNTYTNETIEQLINESYPQIDCEKVFLILDAYDEIEEKNKYSFAKMLNKFANCYSNSIILISARNNFYSFADDNEPNGLFKGFAEYSVVPLSHKDISEYVRNNGINYDDFWTEVRKNELYNLAYSPFYLVELLKIYKRNNSLPVKNELMEEIIKNRFSTDSKKYNSAQELEDDEVEIFVCLRKLAFAIQCMKVIKISNSDYQKLLPNKEDRKLIKYSGIFSKDAYNYWGFEHNNFREYLTAQFLNQLDIEQIQELICSEQGRVFDSWMNVLSFLVLIRDDSDLMHMLFEKDSEMLVRFEKSRIDETDRNSIVIGILENFAEKNIWLSHGYNDADKLAKFGDSQKVIEYLLSQIATPKNFRAQSNAISVLSEIQNKYGMQTQIRSTLFAALKSSTTRNYEKYRILDTLISLGLENEEINNHVIESFSHDLDTYYRLGLLQYLHKVGLHEKYIVFYAEEYNLSGKHYNDSARLIYEILDVFAKVKQGDALCVVLAAIAHHNDTYSSDADKYHEVINNAIACYNNGHTAIFETIIMHMSDSHVHNRGFYKISKLFFETTKTKAKAFIRLAEMDLDLKTFHIIMTMEQIADDECYLSLLTLYENGDLRYEKIIKYLADRLNDDSEVCERYKAALAHNGIEIAPKLPPFDYEKARRDGRQYYFDSLFDKDRYLSLVEKLLLTIGNADMSFAELQQAEHDLLYIDIERHSSEKYTMLQLYFDLGDEHDERPIIATLKAIPDWDYYAIVHAQRTLHQNDIEVREPQRQLFQQYCMNVLKDLDFKKEIHDNDNGGITYTYRAQRFIFFSEFFDFPYDKSVYLNMLLVPYHFFQRNEDNQHGRFPKYVLDKLNENELENQIRYNLANEEMCSDVIDMHIQYCQDNNLDWGVELAEKICMQGEFNRYCKQKCIEYLLQIKGYEYVYDKFLSIADKEMLLVIINLTLKYRDERLKNRLEILSKASEDGKDYISTLIRLNSRYALQRYYEIISKDMKSTDIENDSYVDSTIEAISSVNDATLIDVLGALRVLLFTPGFKDREHFGLQESLYKAYENISQVDYELVKEHLEEGLKNINRTEADKSFCNTLILDLTNKLKRQRDRAWTIREIQNFIKTHAEN